MTIKNLSCSQFNQDACDAKKVADQRLITTPSNLVDLLAMSGADEIDFDPPPVQELFRPADLS